MVNQLTLGNVTIAGETRIAVVTILDDQGNPFVITDEMRAAQGIYLNMIQQIINLRPANELGEIKSMTLAGLICEKGSVGHVAIKTDQLWNGFVYALLHPQSIGKGHAQVNFINSEKYWQMSIEQRHKLVTTIHAKRHQEVFEGATVEYDDDEKLVLDMFRSHRTGPQTDEEEVTALLQLSYELRSRLLAS